MIRSIVGAAIGFPLLALVLVPIERRFAADRFPVLRRGWRTDYAWAVLRPVLELGGLVALGLAVTGAALLVPALVLRPIVSVQPLWLRGIEAFVLMDLLGYWLHRLAHEVPFLWRFHAVHHSSEALDWLATVRDHPLDRGLVGVPALFLVFAGFPVVAVAGALVLVRGIGALWAHLNVRWSLRPLQKVVITPAFHRWHHTTDRDAINHNYAGALPVWDVVFGTYFVPRDRRPAGYGCTEPVPDGIGAQLFYPLRAGQAVAEPV